MSQDHDDREAALSRRHALAWVMGTGTAVLYALSAGKGRRLGLFDGADAASATAQTTPMIPVIVKDTTSLYWQTVLAGARKAGQELGIKITELGAQSESDVAGQINILESAVAANPAAVVIAPAQFAALGRPIDAAAKKVKIIGIQSAADTAAFTSMLATDNVQAGRIAADILAERIQKTYADAEGDVALITSSFGVAAFEQRAKGFKEQTARQLMSDLIAAYPELRGVFASNPMMAQGAAEAAAESKTNKTGDKINLVGFDWDDKVIKFLQDGTIAGLIVQDPFRMGYEGVRAALSASKGEQVPAQIDIAAGLITKANMNSARSQELLKPQVK
jgi:ribose transport system substrate-binding protein